MKSVHELRKSGYKVRVIHNRNFDLVNRFNCVSREVTSRGGSTVVEVASGSRTATGVARCSDKDQYNRKLGVRIALGRALKQLGIN